MPGSLWADHGPPDRAEEQAMASTTTRPARSAPRDGVANGLRLVVGLTAVVFSAVYLASDLVELAHGGFGPVQLALTYAGEAAIPLFVLGLYAVQRPAIGWLGFAGATAYAYTYVFFTGTVLYAIVDDITDWTTLAARLGGWMDVHSILMVVAGIAFGAAVVRARVLPPWTGATLIAGMVAMAVATMLPAAAQTVAAGIRDLAFAAMGAYLLRSPRRPSS
jgi:hypothetical protein